MRDAIKQVAVIGAGALGSAYAALLFTMDGESVSFVADNERAVRLARDGVIVNGKLYRIPVLRSDAEVPPSDLVMVAVKYHHLDNAIRAMNKRVGDGTIIISVMNGIDSEERIGAVYGMDKVLYAIAVGIDAVREGNTVGYTNQGRIFFGEPHNKILSQRVKGLRELFERAGIAFEIPPDMIRMLWWKFMVNVGINQGSAVLRATYGVFQTSPEAHSLMESAMYEVIAIATKAGIELSGKDIEAWNSVLASLNPFGKTSMLQDIEAGRKTEVEMLAGQVIELGRRWNLPTPINQRLYEEIRKIERY